MQHKILIGPFSQIIPMRGMPLKGPLSDEDLELLTDAGILIEGKQIVRIDKFDSLLPLAKEAGAEIHELNGKYCCLPGFVDAHTHICFGGSRARDYALRNSGKTYLEIAREGGGIWDTVTQTRKASEEELVSGIIKRSKLHLKNGTTTLEVKSGYGLSVEEELKMLRAIQQAASAVEQDLIATCLAAHTIPREYEGKADAYLQEVTEVLLPQIKALKLARRVDAFIEESAFSSENIQPYFQKAKALGFDITVHADQFTTSGSEVAV
ncbi:MAG: imidazolonepropionase, partial [Bacteroidota bacterium]